MLRSFLTLTFLLTAGMAHAGMTVDLLPPWDGKKIPKGQHCQLQGGKGATPPMQVAGIPAGTVMLVVQYNDKSYKPLSSKGGHGTIGYPVKGASAKLPAVPGMTAKLPGGVRVVAPARSTGEYASKGYLPPCSGGRGNTYEAVVQAVGADGKVLERVKLKIGRY
ncbi:hypothetical protein KBY27_06530 [Ruegeria pomeroyi]|uniref:Uncharacterized protein n=1 Tax=Ruegeria pomeroyi TaxID=89184 RepID=A0A9Q3ZML9_9RHOB|nr:hypothetical protein [Ruegeria pomeroyi]MCE8537106.1 hypothetical protein [Ruegeria pomeroyi]